MVNGSGGNEKDDSKCGYIDGEVLLLNTTRMDFIYNKIIAHNSKKSCFTNIYQELFEIRDCFCEG